jgi:hypothetical protein
MPHINAFHNMHKIYFYVSYVIMFIFNSLIYLCVIDLGCEYMHPIKYPYSVSKWSQETFTCAKLRMRHVTWGEMLINENNKVPNSFLHQN